ncbi:MAG: hypothetical protein HC831_27035 [Chloroflexia bacterium]|nr:hypothetical protein [Chloroflexia bacterium]
MKKITLLVVFFLYAALSFAQEEVKKEEKKFNVKFNGFVKSEFFWDTRQTVSAREGHFLLWPSAISRDANGDDINAKPNFNFLSIQSRIGVDLTGPDVLNAKHLQN